MKRKEFIASACTLGVCTCIGNSLLAGNSVVAATMEGDEKADWRIAFMQKRFAKLLAGMPYSDNLSYDYQKHCGRKA